MFNPTTVLQNYQPGDLVTFARLSELVMSVSAACPPTTGDYAIRETPDGSEALGRGDIFGTEDPADFEKVCICPDFHSSC